MRRLLYPDWKAEVQCLLGHLIPWQQNEVLWELYDYGLWPRDTAAVFCAELGVVRTGYRGTIRTLYPKGER